jgi:hypothetical protein
MANKYMKRWSTSLMIREVQIQDGPSYILKKQTVTRGREDAQKVQCPQISGGNMGRHSCQESSMTLLQKTLDPYLHHTRELTQHSTSTSV